MVYAPMSGVGGVLYDKVHTNAHRHTTHAHNTYTNTIAKCTHNTLTRTHIHTHARTHIHAHTYTHTLTHTHTHIRTHIRTHNESTVAMVTVYNRMLYTLTSVVVMQEGAGLMMRNQPIRW